MRSRRTALLVLAVLVLAPLIFTTYRVFGPRAPVLHPTILVTTNSPGSTSLEVEQQVTIPLERALGGIRGLSALSSTSAFGVSELRLEVAPNADDAVRTQVLEQLRGVELTDGTSPQLRRSGTAALTYALIPEPNTDLGTLLTLAGWELERQMKQIPGVSDVTECGGRERRVEVRLDAMKLAAYGISSQDAFRALSSHSLSSSPLGSSGYSDLDVLKKVPVPVKAGAVTSVTISDVARIDANALKRPPCIATDGKTEIVISEIVLRSDSDVEKVAHDVSAKLTELGGRFPLRIVPLEM